MALVSTVNFGVREPTGFRQQIDLNVRLDEVATAPVTVFYYLQQGTATAAEEDYLNTSGNVRSLTIPAGSDVGQIEIDIRGDDLIEGDEEFSIILYAGQNAELPNNAAALVATATIYDTDDGGSDPETGTLGAAAQLSGPAAMPGILPTVDVRDVTVVEGTSGSDRAVFLVSLDRPATADVTGFYYFEGETAWTQGSFGSAPTEDFSGGLGQWTIAAGQQSTTIRPSVEPDATNEPNETFHLVLGGVQNGQFSGGAAALVATGTILNDDGAAVVGTAGIGDFAEQIAGPEPASGSQPTMRVYDTSVLEANNFQATTLYFLVTLDQPASEDIPFQFAVNNGTAVSNATTSLFGGDFEQAASGAATILAGRQSAIIPVTVNGDTVIEGDEEVTLVLSGVRGAVFEDNAAALQATGTILSDDDGPVSGPAGIGEPGRKVAPPAASGNQTVLDVVDVRIIEGDTDESDAFVYVTLSEPATGTIEVDFITIAGTAAEGTDFDARGGTLRFVEGQQSSLFSIDIKGDTSIEGDESLTVRFSDPSGAVFANGQNTMDATIEILGNDGAGSAGIGETGPDFTYITPTPGATEGNDVLIGTGGADVLRGQGGNDRLEGGGGNDQLFGGAGNDFLGGGGGADVMVGGTGNDFYIVDNVNDVISGEIAFSLGGGIDTVRTFINNYVQPDNIELVRLGNIDGTGNLNATGNDAPGTLVGNAGNNILTGRGGNDQLNGNNGNDRLIGNTGRDTLVGGNGNDTFVYTAYADSRAGALNRDVINGFGRTAGQNDTIDLRQLDANTGSFGVDDAFTFIGSARFSGTAGELRYQGLGGPNAVIVEADHNGDGAADLQIFVNLTTVMTGSDFLL